MEKSIMTIVLAAALCTILIACSNLAKTPACTEDAKLCPDGSSVGRVGPDCEFAACPGPAGPATQTTFKQFMSQDPQVCMRMKFTCDGDEMFSDATGCGCIRKHNDPAVTTCLADYNPVCGYFDQSVQCIKAPCAETKPNLCLASVDKSVAYTTPGACPDDERTTNTPDTQTPPAQTPPGKRLATDCTEPRPEMCTMDYNPVCGQKADGSKATYGNACGACADPAVVSHYAGECEA